MRAVVCRVDQASVSVEDRVRGSIDRGLLVYVGVIDGDGEPDVQWMAQKLPALRLFNDEAGRMNRSVADIKGGLLLIPNFTLAGWPAARAKARGRRSPMPPSPPRPSGCFINSLKHATSRCAPPAACSAPPCRSMPASTAPSP